MPTVLWNHSVFRRSSRFFFNATAPKPYSLFGRPVYHCSATMRRLSTRTAAYWWGWCCCSLGLSSHVQAFQATLRPRNHHLPMRRHLSSEGGGGSSIGNENIDGSRAMPLNGTSVTMEPSQPQQPSQSRTVGTTTTTTTNNNNINGQAFNMPLPPPPLQGDQPHNADASSRTGVDVASLLAIPPEDIEIVAIETTPLTTESEHHHPETGQPDLLKRLPFVSMFRGSANYIANHRNTLAVYHIPGGLLDLPNDDSTVFRDLMNDVALTWLLGMKIVLVVGCRHQIEKRVHDPERYKGLRITDETTLRIVKEEAGYVRFEVERQLARSLRMQGSGGAAAAGTSSSSSSSGAKSTAGYYDGNVVSGNFYSAQPFGVLDGVDYKYSGFVRRVEVEKIRQLHESRDICLLTTLGVSPSGEVFNVNSESLAACVAGALQASKVIFFTEQEMELRHKRGGNKIQSLRLSDARALVRYVDIDVNRKGYVLVGDNSPTDLDRPARHLLMKMGYCIQALEQGVKRAHIISPKHGALLQELYTRDGSGTLISGDLYEGIRRADVHDVAGIHELIAPLIKLGTLIDRPKAMLEKDIDSYFVYTRDNHIVAVGQLKQFENGFAEIGCLVVNKDYRSRGRGDAILGYLERLCLLNGCSTVFVLSTQTMEWFVERGFDEVDVDRLPPSRQQTYNYARRSKIYMKTIENSRDLDASELWWNR